MVACPQYIALRLRQSTRTTIVNTSSTSSLINWAFEDTMYQDALLSEIHVFDHVSDWLGCEQKFRSPSNYLVCPLLK